MPEFAVLYMYMGVFGFGLNTRTLQAESLKYPARLQVIQFAFYSNDG